MTSNNELKETLSVTRPQTSLRVQVVEKLRNAILDGHIAPGVRLTEREVGELVGVSRTLVREALRQLEAEGLVDNVPYRGPSVARISPQEARQLYEIRAALEGWAAKSFAEQASAEDFERLRRSVEDLAVAQQAGDTSELLSKLEIFHEILLGGAGNPMLSNYLQSLRGRLRRLRHVSLAQPGRPQRTVEEKRILLAALAERDGEKARRARERYILDAAKAVQAALEQQS